MMATVEVVAVWVLGGRRARWWGGVEIAEVDGAGARIEFVAWDGSLAWVGVADDVRAWVWVWT